MYQGQRVAKILLCKLFSVDSATRIFLGIKIQTAHYNSMTGGCSLTRQRKKGKSKKKKNNPIISPNEGSKIQASSQQQF